MSTERRAAIDIGTVTTRLMVADVTGDVVRELVRRSVITHLGEGWTTTGVLSEEGIARVERTVAGFVAEARTLGAGRIACVATSAARDAANGAEFMARIERAGVRPEIIPGEREAYLTFLGATYGLHDERVLVADIGGGSTEIVIGRASCTEGVHATDIEVARSLDVGSRRVTELFLHSDPPTPHEVAQAEAWIAGELRQFFTGVRIRPRDMVAVAGTATSFAAIDLELDPYDPERTHGHRIARPQLLGMVDRLAGLSLEERRRVVGLEPDRAGVIVAGGLILEAVLACAGLSSTLVSEHDILYGIVLDYADNR